MNRILYLSFIFFIVNSFSYSQIIDPNSISTICSPLDLSNLKKYISLEHLQNTLKKSINSSPSPLNNLDVLNSVVRNENPCPFREKVLLKMSRNETINLTVVGGSLTKGAIVNNNRWSNKLSDFLNNGWYTNEIKVTNIAVGA